MKVMTLNTWGMPAKLGAWDKEERMAAIGRYLARGEYDVILLEVSSSAITMTVIQKSNVYNNV